MITKLKNHLKISKINLEGNWVKKNSSYEGDICKLLDMKEERERYWDAKWKNLCIEFKKGNSIWLDLVRYSEILLNENENTSKKTFTLFFIPNKERSKIIEIIGVDTVNIIQKLNLTLDNSDELIRLNKTVPRSLNAQASLTTKDIGNIATFIV